MAFNRELSQFGHYLVVDDATGKIAITTTSTPNVGIGTIDPQFKLDVLGSTRIDGDATITGNLNVTGDLVYDEVVGRNINITGFSTFIGVSTFKDNVFVDGDIDFGGDLYKDGRLFVTGVGIGSTAINPESGVIGTKIGAGFTDINFVGTGLTVIGYGSTVVIDLNNLAVRADATIPPLTILNSEATLESNTGYLTNTVGAGFTVILPLVKNPGDFIELHDTEVSWDINNLMVATQNNEQFKNYSGTIDSPLACDVSGATVKLVWTNTYWRVFA